MSKFPTYSMAAIGVAAAFGFVFVLSFFSNNAVIDTADENLELFQESSSSEPSSLLIQEKSDSQGMGARMESAKNGKLSTEGNASQMMQQDPHATSLRPTLVAIIASDGITGESIGELFSGMQFQAHKPVFIKANFMNANDAPISNHLIAIGISSANETSMTSFQDQGLSYEEAATFRGDISANGNVELELNWNPTRLGNYVLLLFSITPEDLTNDEGITPVESISVRVVEDIP